jgi:hypothetical protein
VRNKGVDVVLAILIVAGLVYGASVLGNAVTRESKTGIAGDPGVAKTTTSNTSGARSRTRRLQIRVALFVVAALVGIAVVLSAMSAYIRRPRHHSRGHHGREPRRR